MIECSFLVYEWFDCLFNNYIIFINNFIEFTPLNLPCLFCQLVCNLAVVCKL